MQCPVGRDLLLCWLPSTRWACDYLKGPEGLNKAWEGKLKAVRQSDAQLDVSVRSLDPADREGARTYVKATTNLPGEEEGAASGSKDAKKRRRK